MSCSSGLPRNPVISNSNHIISSSTNSPCFNPLTLILSAKCWMGDFDKQQRLSAVCIITIAWPVINVIDKSSIKLRSSHKPRMSMNPSSRLIWWISHVVTTLFTLHFPSIIFSSIFGCIIIHFNFSKPDNFNKTHDSRIRKQTFCT